MELKPGSRWRSTVCDTEVVIVRPPSSEVSLECGGAPMEPSGNPAGEKGSVDPAHAGGTQLGKRFADADLGLEVLATKAGAGSLSVDGKPLPLKEAKPLPASD